MEKILNIFKKLTLINKIILLSFFALFSYFVFTTVQDYRETSRVSSEISSLNFKVKQVYFNTGFSLRTVFDKSLILVLENPISREQFDNFSFLIPGEEVSAEMVNERKIKINLISKFQKSKKSYLQVNFYNTNIYRFNYISSDVDEEYFKNVTPDKSPMDTE